MCGDAYIAHETYHSDLLYMRFGFFISYLILAQVCLVSVPGTAQVLESGDTLLFGYDMLPANPRIAMKDAQGFWDMSVLNSPFFRQVVISEASGEELQFSDVEGLGHRIAVEGDDMWVSSIQARIGGVAVWGGQNDPFPLWRADISSSPVRHIGKTTFNVPLAILASQSDPTIALADSARVEYAWEYYTSYDAQGMLELGRRVQEVARMAVRKRISGSVLVKDNGVWSESDYEFDVELPIELRAGTAYYFWDANVAGPVVVVEEDAQGKAVSARFQAGDAGGKRIVASAPKGLDIYVNPNPSFGDVRFELFNLPKGEYTIEVYSILGVLLRSIELEAAGSMSYPVNLSDLNKGTYIYRLVDPTGKTVRSKRLVIITP